METDLFHGKYRIKSTRLKDWDYAQSAYYFVTICVKDREKVFGRIVKQKVELTELGYNGPRKLDKKRGVIKRYKSHENNPRKTSVEEEIGSSV